MRVRTGFVLGFLCGVACTILGQKMGTIGVPQGIEVETANEPESVKHKPAPVYTEETKGIPPVALEAVNRTVRLYWNDTSQDAKLMLEPRTMLSLADFVRAPIVPRHSASSDRLSLFGSTDFPYLNAVSFRAMCDIGCDLGGFMKNVMHSGRCKFDAKQLPNRSMVYINPSYYAQFIGPFNQIAEAGKYIFLMTHLVDNPWFPPWLLDSPFVLKWFAVNIALPKHSHPKLVPIPLGIHVTTSDRIVGALKSAHPEQVLPGYNLFARWQFGKAPKEVAQGKKTPLEKILVKQFPGPIAAAHQEELHTKPWVAELAKHKFCVCAVGNGLDTYKVWETLYNRRVPILGPAVDKKGLDFPLEMLDELPYIWVDRWEELTPKFLQDWWDKSMRDTTPRYNLDKLYMPWWEWWVAKLSQQVQ
eukprot:TRINITY_DN21139_c0_g1_i1.p1 TRINITY_DN21139_c0_g1~~TRINITY_DN21139_c0_g1_i1.p1  ORF type:complete len:416 (-),score=6.79 TRINITY_DN21139_c0_g1_i1:27-1274(-)